MAPWGPHLADVMFSTNLSPADRVLSPQGKPILQRQGRWNEAFCDGHVENGGLAKFFDFRKDQVLMLWNRDNQPHR